MSGQTARVRIIPLPADAPETIADRLTRLRMSKDWTQEALAERSGVSRDNISRIERGRHWMLAYTLDALADALDVSLDYLWRGDDERVRSEAVS